MAQKDSNDNSSKQSTIVQDAVDGIKSHNKQLDSSLQNEEQATPTPTPPTTGQGINESHPGQKDTGGGSTGSTAGAGGGGDWIEEKKTELDFEE